MEFRVNLNKTFSSAPVNFIIQYHIVSLKNLSNSDEKYFLITDERLIHTKSHYTWIIKMVCKGYTYKLDHHSLYRWPSSFF